MRFFVVWLYLLQTFSIELHAQKKVFYSTDLLETDSISSNYYVIQVKGVIAEKSPVAYYTGTSAVFYTDVKKEGQDETERTYYYPSGKIKMKGNFFGSRPIGLIKSFYEDGSPQGEFEFEKVKYPVKHDPILGILNYYDSVGDTVVKNGSGYCHCDLSPHEARALIESGAVEKGFKNGQWIGEDKTRETQFVELYNDGTLISGTLRDQGQEINYKLVLEAPTYSGGIEALYKKISSEVKYPKSARRTGIEGTVYLSFVIDTDGALINPTVIKGIGGQCDVEAVRVVSTLNNWSPGKIRGKPVKVGFTLPMKFKLR